MTVSKQWPSGIHRDFGKYYLKCTTHRTHRYGYGHVTDYLFWKHIRREMKDQSQPSFTQHLSADPTETLSGPARGPGMRGPEPFQWLPVSTIRDRDRNRDKAAVTESLWQSSSSKFARPNCCLAFQRFFQRCAHFRQVTFSCKQYTKINIP